MTGGGSLATGVPPDIQYELAHRRAARRAVGLTVVSVAVGVAAMFAVLAGAGPLEEEIIARPGGAAPIPAAGGCTAADLAKPALTTMPSPQVVTSPLTIRPGPDVERLSPPDASPAVDAARAWSVMRRDRAAAPTTAGSTQVLLGDLYAATPALLEPGRPARPLYTHTLVWAIYGRHQPEPPSTRIGGVPCYFESTVFYVDATTGRALVAEVFPPVAGPSVAA